MKRKFNIENIEIILPNKKRAKISKLSIKFEKMISDSEFEEMKETLFPKNQQQYFNKDDILSESEYT